MTKADIHLKNALGERLANIPYAFIPIILIFFFIFLLKMVSSATPFNRSSHPYSEFKDQGIY